VFPLPDAPAGPIGEPILEGAAALDRTAARQAEKTGCPSLAVASPETEKQSYTNRLLRAKQRVWEEREKDKEGDQTKP
jgi:hypothetical protein